MKPSALRPPDAMLPPEHSAGRAEWWRDLHRDFSAAPTEAARTGLDVSGVVAATPPRETCAPPHIRHCAQYAATYTAARPHGPRAPTMPLAISNKVGGRPFYQNRAYRDGRDRYASRLCVEDSQLLLGASVCLGNLPADPHLPFTAALLFLHRPPVHCILAERSPPQVEPSRRASGRTEALRRYEIHGQPSVTRMPATMLRGNGTTALSPTRRRMAFRAAIGRRSTASVKTSR